MEPITVWIEKEGEQDTGERSVNLGKNNKGNYHITNLAQLLAQLQESASQSINAQGKLTVQVQGAMVASDSAEVGWRPIFKIQGSSQQTQTLTITLETEVSPNPK